VTDARDRYIPVRKDDIRRRSASADPDGSEKFRRLCEMMAAIYHYENFTTLERLRGDYYYFNPQVAHHATADRAMLERCYGDLLQSLDAPPIARLHRSCLRACCRARARRR
jgi:hypothetical protein